jgi:hypothetical protein
MLQLSRAAVGGEQAPCTFFRTLAASEFVELGLEFLIHGDVRIAIELNEVGEQD